PWVWFPPTPTRRLCAAVPPESSVDGRSVSRVSNPGTGNSEGPRWLAGAFAVVDRTGIEPVASSVSGRRATATPTYLNRPSSQPIAPHWIPAEPVDGVAVPRHNPR